MKPQHQLHQLTTHLQALGPIAIAVSGGVDSMTLAVVAHRCNAHVEVFHAVSAAVPQQATARVKLYADNESWQLKLIDAGETSDPAYMANPANRCYFCKTKLYDRVSEHTQLTVLSGTNLDDLGDYRPGLEAASQHQVQHPYVDLKIDKAGLRSIAKYLQLNDIFDLPASPCLSSRIETGIAIEPRLLPIINQAELALRQILPAAAGIKSIRCRLRKNGIVIELDGDTEFDSSAEYIQAAVSMVHDLFASQGYEKYVNQIGVEPYQRGSAFLIETLSLD